MRVGVGAVALESRALSDGSLVWAVVLVSTLGQSVRVEMDTEHSARMLFSAFRHAGDHLTAIEGRMDLLLARRKRLLFGDQSPPSTHGEVEFSPERGACDGTQP
jgi:hypothetical protein